MSGSTLRRWFVAVLVLALSLLPMASAQAAPRNGAAENTLEIRIQQIGRILLQAIERLVQGPPPPNNADNPNPTPHGSDGVGIDPFGRRPGG